jgi:hypothetical protein
MEIEMLIVRLSHMKGIMLVVARIEFVSVCPNKGWLLWGTTGCIQSIP